MKKFQLETDEKVVYKKLKRKKRLKVTALILLIIIIVLSINYTLFMRKAEKRFHSFDNMVKTMETSYGKVSYIDEGSGETILICHGIFGGYDQGYSCFKNLTDKYRILTPSRFGYPGTDLPNKATVTDQAEQYAEFLDYLGLNKVYVLGTSSGGACALRFAKEHPERVKGLILYCSGGIRKEKPQPNDITSYVGIPKFFCEDIPLWLISPILKKVMNCSDEDWLGVFPTSLRKDGVINDGYNSNRDLSINYDDYDLHNFDIPVIAFHSKDDKLSNYDDIVNTINLVPNGRLVSFEKGGHMMTGNSSTIDKELQQFIDRTK